MANPTLHMDVNGRFYTEKRVYTTDSTTVHCPTKGCFRNKGNYDLEVRGSDYCDNCGETMVPRKSYETKREYCDEA